MKRKALQAGILAQSHFRNPAGKCTSSPIKSCQPKATRLILHKHRYRSTICCRHLSQGILSDQCSMAAHLLSGLRPRRCSGKPKSLDSQDRICFLLRCNQDRRFRRSQGLSCSTSMKEHQQNQSLKCIQNHSHHKCFRCLLGILFLCSTGNRFPRSSRPESGEHFWIYSVNMAVKISILICCRILIAKLSSTVFVLAST